MSDDSINYDEKLFQVYNIDPEQYKYIPVSALNLKVRTSNRLQGNNIQTVSALLKWTFNDLMKIQGFGVGCVYDLNQGIRHLIEEKEEKKALGEDIAFLASHKSDIFSHDYSFIRNKVAREKIQQKYEKVFNDLDAELIERLKDDKESLHYLLTTCEIICKQLDLWTLIPENRLKKPARRYLGEYLGKDYNDEKMLERIKPGDTLADFLSRDIFSETREKTLFVKWCARKINDEGEKILIDLKEKTLNVIKLRSEGKTLEEVGSLMGVTRERIRQIEKKGTDKIISRSMILKLPQLIAADSITSMISEDDFHNFFGNNGKIFFYIYKGLDDEILKYNRQYDVFLAGRDDSFDDEIAFVDTMPEIFRDSELEKFIKEGAQEEGVSEEQLRTVIASQYKITGNVYHKSRLSLSKVYLSVVKQYFPNGIHISDETDLKRFRTHLHEDYGDIAGEASKHSIEAIIARVCILCGRGTYKPKQDKYIPDTLLNRIDDYIKNENQPIFFIRSIFLEFETELKEFGVDNHYFLQGILKENFGDKYYVSRDYVSKDKNIRTIHGQIEKFVKSQDYVISKAKIKEKFSGVTPIIIDMTLMEPDILSYFGGYIYADNLRLYDSDVEYLRGLIEELIRDGKPHHCQELYDAISSDRPELLGRLQIDYEYSLFSVINYIFGDDYEFSRPYIAAKGMPFTHPDEIIRTYVEERDVACVRKIFELCEKYNFRQTRSKFEYLFSFETTHMFIERYEIALVDYIGITEGIVNRIEELLAGKISETMPISAVSKSYFPKINIAWNDWILFGGIHRWGKLFDVDTGFNQTYESAVILISPKGEMNNKKFSNNTGRNIKIDDLDNIDSLIEDEIGDELDDL